MKDDSVYLIPWHIFLVVVNAICSFIILTLSFIAHLRLSALNINDRAALLRHLMTGRTVMIRKGKGSPAIYVLCYWTTSQYCSKLSFPAGEHMWALFLSSALLMIEGNFYQNFSPWKSWIRWWWWLFVPPMNASNIR